MKDNLFTEAAQQIVDYIANTSSLRDICTDEDMALILDDVEARLCHVLGPLVESLEYQRDTARAVAEAILTNYYKEELDNEMAQMSLDMHREDCPRQPQVNLNWSAPLSDDDDDR